MMCCVNWRYIYKTELNWIEKNIYFIVPPVGKLMYQQQSERQMDVVTRVRFIVQVNTQVLIRVHYLNVRSLDVLQCAPTEIHHQLLGFPHVTTLYPELSSVSRLTMVETSENFCKWQLGKLIKKCAV
ncbi:hypothetical protein ATANTOWER_023176 [Ataeniobius toweri]|uniref:Uncharacterized protein n=1 Tax=Ataeniobius toweri TaxID=208326 RepID=A0ABU7AS96_9TELE|nr:hypothetical protein [Ataeniobius toweri]